MPRTVGYPWKKWFSKKRFRLQVGKHFDCLIHGMVGQIRNRASREGRRVSIQIVGKELIVTMLNGDE